MNYQTSIVWSWSSGITVLRMDGTTTYIPPGSLTVTGLTAATTYYFYPYYNDPGSYMQWAPGGHGSPAVAATAPTDALTMYQNRQGNIALSAGAMVAATTASGTGGGGSGGGTGVCLRSDMLVETRERGLVEISTVEVGEHLACPEGWTEIVAKALRPQMIFVHIKTVAGELIITPTHPLTLANNSEKRAQELTISDVLQCRSGVTGIESLELISGDFEKVLLTCEPHHRFFAGATDAVLVAHNMRPMPC